MAGRSNTSREILAPRYGFMIVALALLLCGLVMAYSASTITSISAGGAAHSYLISQAAFAAVGGAIAFIVYRVFPLDIWKGDFTYLVWIVCCGLIAATAIWGTAHGGATRWLVIAGRELQPSEFAKIGFALITCKFVYMLDSGEIDLKQFLIRFALCAGIPLAVIYVSQSDLGTTVICGLCILAVLYFTDKPLTIIIGIVIIAALLVAVAVFGTTYRSDRWVYLDPWNDGKGGFGNGYQTIHSLYALADGGLFGTGLGNSREKFLYLPANNTDYVFAVVCEELGVIGAFAIVLLFLALLFFGLRISQSCSSSFGRALAGCLTTMLCAQAFLNIGCAISLFPMTGKPLPFFSVGGSSMLSTMIILGFILAASRDAENNGPEAEYARRRADLRVTTRVSDAPSRVDAPRQGRASSRNFSSFDSSNNRSGRSGRSSSRGRR